MKVSLQTGLLVALLACDTPRPTDSEPVLPTEPIAWMTPESTELYRFEAPLGRVEHVAVVDQRVFVADETALKIKVFSLDDGEFLYEFGSRGTLPGSFQSISAMAVIDENTIVVWDRAGTFATEFSFEGEIIGGHHLAGGDVWPQRAYDLGESLVGLYVLPAHFSNDSLIHEINNPAERKSSFLSISEVVTQWKDDVVLRALMIFPGHILLTSAGLRAFVPGVYSGTVFLFDDQWRLVESLKSGYGRPETFVTQTTAERVESPGPTCNFRGAGQGVYWIGCFTDLAQGLMKTTSGDLLVMTSNIRIIDGVLGSTLDAEHYSPEGDYLGYYRIAEAPSGTRDLRHVFVASDGRGGFFLSQTSQDGIVTLSRHSLPDWFSR